MLEEYEEKMARKSMAELNEYVAGRAQYREDAVLAALDELIRRGQPHPETDQLRPQLTAVVQAQMAAAVAAEAEEEAELEAETGPVLYSLGTVTLFSVLFSMLAGGALLAINVRELRRTRALAVLAGFVVGYLVLGVLLLAWIIQHYGLNPMFGALFDLPAILAYNLWFWPRYIRTNVFQSRSWLMPFAICAAIKIALAVFLAQYVARFLVNTPT